MEMAEIQIDNIPSMVTAFYSFSDTDRDVSLPFGTQQVNAKVCVDWFKTEENILPNLLVCSIRW